ncbi:MAG: hypothetical protein AVDCRST_MAG40-720, partial [uncultured Gemmatimonadaceae bacterium]
PPPHLARRVQPAGHRPRALDLARPRARHGRRPPRPQRGGARVGVHADDKARRGV